ncbi:hypothetical protein AAC387_Pa11g0928 [Persea americana]
MASTNSTSAAALFLSLNLVFFAFATATQSVPCPPPPSKAKPTPNPTTPTTPSSPAGTCPRDALKLGVCANVLGLVNAKVGSPPTLPCCSLIQGLVDLEAAVCLCTALKANVLGINLNIPLSLSLLLNVCGKRVPTEFQCA